MISSIPVSDDIHAWFSNEHVAREFLKRNGAVDTLDSCVVCHGPISLHGAIYRCTTPSCRWSRSLWAGSFFSQSRLKCDQIMKLAYYWLGKCSHEQLVAFTGISPKTVTIFGSYFRQLVSSSLDTDDTIVGGEGVIVEIDESKFGKRKYNVGHRVGGAWVIGGVERTSEKLVFAEVVQNRNAETIIDVLSRHVARGSVIYTDCWRGYSSLSDSLDVHHLTVNHSKNFVDPETGVHTNSIEALWGSMKRSIPARRKCVHLLGEDLLEYIWRKKNSKALWDSFLFALREVGYD
jgi:hypothetical protein